MGDTCNSHDGMCEQITETREEIAALKVRVEPIPEMQKTLVSIDKKLSQFTGVRLFLMWLIPVAISTAAMLKH